MSTQSTLERAFALAREGQARSTEDLRRQLKSERYEAVDSHLAGSTIQKQLKQLMKEAR